jgi:hypothetical protein
MDNYNELLTFLSDFSKTEHNDAGSKANGFFKQLKTADTYIMLKIVISIFKHMETTNTVLQSKSLDFKLSVQIQYFRRYYFKFERYISHFMEICKERMVRFKIRCTKGI